MDDTKNFATAAVALQPDQYAAFKRAIETGRWPDGTVVDAAKRELMLQAIIIYEKQHCAPEQHSGFVPQHCASKPAVQNRPDDGNDGDASAALIGRSGRDTH